MACWRVLTWNVHGAAHPDLGLLAEVVARAAPDAVALQEVRRHQAAAIATRLGWEHEWVFKHNASTPLLWWRAEGLAILSPERLADVVRVDLTPARRRSSYHRRVMIAATVRRRTPTSESMRLYDTHLATDDRRLRVAQARQIAATVTTDAHPLVVVAGDLNGAGEADVLGELAGAGVVDPGGLPTSSAAAPYQRIDYVLVPAAAEVTDRRTPPGGPAWAALSDHLPVLVELRCAPSSAAAPSR